MRRALRPGGRLAGIVYSTPEANGYETADGFEGPCELLVAAGTAPA